MRDVGEASAHVTEETATEHPQIPCQDIGDIRNRIVHGYFDIEFDIVWNTITDNIPPKVVHLEAILEPPQEK
jgi:uncharacterized protein with HEPN domain